MRRQIKWFAHTALFIFSNIMVVFIIFSAQKINGQHMNFQSQNGKEFIFARGNFN